MKPVALAAEVTGARGGSERAYPPRWPAAALWQSLACVAAAMLIGLLVVAAPRAAIALGLAPLGLLALQSVHARIGIVVFGGLLLFDSSAGVSFAKLLYLAGLALCVLGAWLSCSRTMRDGAAAAIRAAAAVAFVVMSAVIALSLPVALLNGHEIELWVRDVAPYALLAVSPILAADAARNASRSVLVVGFVVAGLVVTFAASLQLIGLRGLASSPVRELAVYTGLALPAALLAYASARALHGDRRADLLWGSIAGTILSALLITGTRSGLLLLCAPLVVLLYGRARDGLQRAATLGALAAVVVVAFFALGPSLGLDTRAAQERLLTTGVAIEAPLRNGSLRDRFAQSAASWDVVGQSPALGAGPGHLFTWSTPTGVPREEFALDSTVSTVAKFGFVGGAGIAGFLILMWRLARLSPDASVGRAALAGFAAWAAVSAVIANPIEDKGAALGLLFILALGLRVPVVSAQRGRSSRAPARPATAQA